MLSEIAQKLQQNGQVHFEKSFMWELKVQSTALVFVSSFQFAYNFLVQRDF